MAQTVATLNVTLASDPGASKRMYTDLKKAVVWTTPEFDWYKDFDDSDIVISAQNTTPASQMYMPIDVQQGFGAAAIGDGGREALPNSPVIQYGLLTLVHWNARIGMTRQAMFLNKTNRASMVTAEINFKRQKRLEALRHKAALNFYGYQTGIIGQIGTAVSGTATGCVITITNAFTDTGLTNTSYINQFVNIGDQIALLADSTSTGTLLAGGVGLVTGKTLGNVFTVNWSAALTITSSAAIAFANAAGYGDTLARTDTDQNNWVPGLKDMIQSTSLHGVSGATYPGWSAAINNTSGGRFTPVKLQNMRQTMANFGAPLKRLVIAQGVQRDMLDQNNALLRFDGIAGIQFDGSFKTTEEQSASRYTPNGFVFGIADGALKKKVLGDFPDASAGEMDKLENYARYVEGEDFLWLTACEKRKGLSAYSALTES